MLSEQKIKELVLQGLADVDPSYSALDLDITWSDQEAVADAHFSQGSLCIGIVRSETISDAVYTDLCISAGRCLGNQAAFKGYTAMGDIEDDGPN